MILCVRCMELEAEILRLKAGQFTEQELQNLCHTFSADDRRRFEQGCRDYQIKLFGTDEVKHSE